MSNFDNLVHDFVQSTDHCKVIATALTDSTSPYRQALAELDTDDVILEYRETAKLVRDAHLVRVELEEKLRKAKEEEHLAQRRRSAARLSLEDSLLGEYSDFSDF